jgi:hypothetical protein
MAKSRKVGESAASYDAKPAPKTAAPAVRVLDEKTAKKLADKIFAERKDLLRKLAQ